MKPILKLVHIVAVVGLIPLASASPIEPTTFSNLAMMVDFEDLPAGNCNGCGTVVTNQYSLLGLFFENPSFPNEATIQNNLTFSVPNASGSNILYVRQGGMVGDVPADPFRIGFASPIHLVGFNFLTSADAGILLRAFSGDILVASVEVAGNPVTLGWGGFAGLGSQIAFSRLEVSSYLFVEPSRTLNFAIDNLQFEAVPEPSSLMLGLIGLAGIVWKAASSRGSRP